MPKYRLSVRQFSWLIASYIVSPAIINMPQHLARLASMDAWITQLGPILYAFVLCYLYFRLAKVFLGKNFFEINLELAGKWGGKFINAIFLLHIWFILARDTALFTGFIKTNMLLRTPYEVSLLLLMIVLIYYGKTSLEVTARVNDIFFPLVVLMVALLPLLLANDFSLFQLEPVFVEPPADVGLANALSVSYYTDITAFAAFLPAVANPRSLYAAFRHGLAITAMLITWILITGICVLGPTIMSREIYPTYALIQQIHITDFLDRMEVFIFSVYFPTFIVSITISFFAILIGLASFTKSNLYQSYSRTAGWFILITLVFAFGGTPEVTMFANYGFPVFIFAVQPPAVILIFILGLRKIKQLRKEQNNGVPATKADSSGGKSLRLFRSWRRRTHWLLAIGVADIIIGLYTAKDYQWIGRLCAVLYLIVLAALLLSTWKEVKSSEGT